MAELGFEGLPGRGVLACGALTVLMLATAACSSEDEQPGPTTVTSTGAGGQGAGGSTSTGGTGGTAGGGAAGGQSSGGGGAAPVAQMVLLDETYEHNTTTMAFTYFDVPGHVPADLSAPVDFAGGQIHQRVIVNTKPGDLGINYQMCFFQDVHDSAHHACTSHLSVAQAGDQDESDSPLSDIWQSDVIDWTRELLDLMLVVKDADGNPVDTRYGFDGGWAGSPDLGLYYPMEVRYTAVLVPVGASFEGFPP